MELKEVKKKLRLADYLLNRTYAESYPKGALNHILEAAKLLVVELTGLDKDRLGPQVIQNKLEKLDEEEAEDFGKFYLKLWQLNKSKEINKKSARDYLKKLKGFVKWIEENKLEIKNN